MNSVSPTGNSFATSRSDASRFLSQSENDVAAAFAELFRSECLDSASTSPPPPAPPPASQSDAPRRGDASASAPTAQDEASQPATAPVASGSAADDREDRDREREDERDEPVASAVVPTTAPQATPEPTPAAGESSEDQELKALLAEVNAVQKEAAAGTETTEGSPTAASSGEGAIPFATLLPESQEATGAAEKETASDPIAEAAPRIDVPLETEIVDPLRRGEPVEEDSEEGFAIEDVAGDINVDEEALAELLAKASGIEEGGRDAKTSGREDRSAADRESKENAAEAIGVASPSVAEKTADATSAVATVEGTASATKSEFSAVEPAASNLTTSVSARREEPSGSLLRSTERSSDSDRRFASGADRSRFMDRVERAFQAAEQGDGAIRMRLHPGELGSMQLTLERGETGEWIARIETETAEAKQALLENAPALKERLAEQDFRLARFEVETPADRRQQEPRDFQQNPQGFSKGRDRRDDEKSEERVQGESAPTGAASADRSRRLDVTI